MHKQHYIRSVLLAALALPALAQDPAGQTAPPKAQGPVLVVKTARPEVAGRLAMGFGRGEDLPELAADAHYVLSLGADRKLNVGTGAGDVGLVQVTADPGALMDLFAEQVEAGKPMIRGTLTLALQPQGFTPKEVAAFVDDLFASPRQMQRLSLKVVGDPENVTEKGLDITLLMEPKAGVPVAAMVEALQPCSLGAPMLADSANAAIHVRGSLAPESLKQFFAPFLGVMARMTSQGEEQKQKNVALYERFLKLHDGGFGASFSEKFQGQFLFGVLDAQATQQLVGSEEYVALMQNQMMANRDMEIEITPNAFEHRGIKVMKSRVTNDGPSNPVMPDGVLDSFFAVAGTYFVGAIGGKETDAKALIDAAVDQKVKRAPLADGAVFHLAVDIRAMVTAVRAQMGADAAGPVDDMPAKFTMELGKRDKALLLHVHVQ